MWTKICANTNLADAQLAAELGADAVGFVFAASKRQVTPGQVRAITAELPSSVEKVGVFSTQDAGEIADAVRAAGLTAVQLHCAYEPELVRALNEALEAHTRLVQVVKVPVEHGGDAAMEELAEALCDPGLFAVLLDAAKAGASGGLGVAFSWRGFAPQVRAARKHASDWARRQGGTAPLLLLAGGLHAGNVREAIATLSPDGVDVASGVEAEPGRKSLERLREFLEAVRKAEADVASEKQVLSGASDGV